MPLERPPHPIPIHSHFPPRKPSLALLPLPLLPRQLHPGILLASLVRPTRLVDPRIPHRRPVELTHKVEVAHDQGNDDFGLHDRELLADAAAGPLLKGPEGILAFLGGEERAVRERGFVAQEPLGDELGRVREVPFVAVDEVDDGPDVEAGDGEVQCATWVGGVGARERQVLGCGVLADGGGGREETQGLLHDGVGVLEPVDDVRVRFDLGGDGGRGGVLAEDDVEFFDELCVHEGVPVEQVEHVGDGGGGGVVAGEDEGLHAVDGHLAEVCVHRRVLFHGGGELFLVRVECQVDDGAFAVLERGGFRMTVHGLLLCHSRCNFAIEFFSE